MLALGALVIAASQADHSLRSLYCALVGSKFASVTAAGQMTAWLLEQNKALVSRVPVTAEQRQTAESLLDSIGDAAKTRNRLVHDLWAVSGSDLELVQSKRGQHAFATRRISLDEILSTIRQLTEASASLYRWTHETFGSDLATIEAQLRWEDYLLRLSPEERQERDDRLSAKGDGATNGPSQAAP